MIQLEEAFDNFWHFVKQVKSDAGLLYENTSVLSADQEGLFTELLDANRELANLELNIAKARGAFYKLLPLAYTKDNQK